MRLSDRFAHLSDMFNLTAHDWCEVLNSLEELPPRKRTALIHNDFEELVYCND